MQKAEAQHSPQHSQPNARQSKGASLESPQGEQIAQLEAMVESSPQTQKLAQLAAMANNSPAAAAQRKWQGMIHNSPQVTAQRQKLGSLAGETAQRVEEEEPLQGKFSPDTLAQLKDEPAARPNNTGLPDNIKSGIEALSGMSMDHVKVHYNSSQPAQLNALAYAQGTDIHVASGQEKHLPHEAWHVVQQAQGRVKPTMQMKEGVPVNDDAGLEHEADVMGAKALMQGNANTAQQFRSTGSDYAAHSGGTQVDSIPAAVPIFRPSPAQRRLSNPANLGTASAAVVSGARTALVETALDIYRSGNVGQDYVANTLALRTARAEMTEDVAALTVDNLRQKIARVRTDHPDQVFDSANFDVRPAGGTQGATYVAGLVTATLAKMQAAADTGITLRSIFGDGDPTSVASTTAAGTARTKILQARTRLNGFLNIYIDTSGVSRRVGIGGYANFDRKIFLLVADVNAAPSNAAISTLFHESMHLAHAEILDEGGYSSTGTRFSGAQIQEKLTNADHYAEVAKVLDGETTHVLPFTPADPTVVVPAARTNPADTADTMAVRNNVMHRCRQLWSGAADYFMKAVRDKRNNDDWWNRKDTSKKLNMTYHNTGFFDTPELNETDLSLAEGTVNRIHRFTGSVTTKMKNAADNVFTFIRDTYNAATGTGDAKRRQAGKDVLVAEGTASDILAPQDKTPSVAERFDSISR